MSDLEELVRRIVRDELAKSAKPANDDEPAKRPGSLFVKRGRLWMRIKTEEGRWTQRPTGCDPHERPRAEAMLHAAQEAIAKAKAHRAIWKQGGARIDLAKPGHVYAIAVIPECRPGRLKIGFTAQDPSDRLGQIMVCNPYARLLRSWPGTPLDELRVHALIEGRIGTSEVFETRNPDAALAQITAYFAERRAMEPSR